MATRKRRSGVGPVNQAEAAGKRYAEDQIGSDYFMDWVRSQLAEAARMDPSTVLPLETKADAKVIANNMLQQLEWDTKRDLDGREIARLIGGDPTREDTKEFFGGFRSALDASRDWLADELLRLKGEMRGGVREAARRRPEIVYVYMGMIERGPKYDWKEGWSENGRTYPWLTKREAQADARNRGATAKFVRNGGGSVGEARRVEAIHGYDIEVVFNDKESARKYERETSRILQIPLTSQHAIRDGYSLVYGPIERDDYRRLEGVLYKRFGNAVLVRLVQRMYAGERVNEATRPRSRAAERMYHVIAINERTSKKTYLTRTPVTHQEALTILRKQRPHKDVRKQLEPA